MDFFLILNKKENKVPGTICFEIGMLSKKPTNYYIMFQCNPSEPDVRCWAFVCIIFLETCIVCCRVIVFEHRAMHETKDKEAKINEF